MGNKTPSYIITGHLNPKAITIDLQAKSKKEALERLTDLLIACGEVEEKEREEIVKALLEREKMGSTGIGYGIAIPHGKCKSIKDINLAVGRCKDGIPFDSIDGKAVNLLFLLLTSPEASQLSLKALARLSRFLKDKKFRDTLIRVNSPEEMYEVIKEKEKKNSIP